MHLPRGGHEVVKYAEQSLSKAIIRTVYRTFIDSGFSLRRIAHDSTLCDEAQMGSGNSTDGSTLTTTYPITTAVCEPHLAPRPERASRRIRQRLLSHRGEPS